MKTYTHPFFWPLWAWVRDECSVEVRILSQMSLRRRAEDSTARFAALPRSLVFVTVKDKPPRRSRWTDCAVTMCRPWPSRRFVSPSCADGTAPTLPGQGVAVRRIVESSTDTHWRHSWVAHSPVSHGNRIQVGLWPSYHNITIRGLKTRWEKATTSSPLPVPPTRR